MQMRTKCLIFYLVICDDYKGISMIVQGHFQKRVQTEVCIDSTPALAQDRELRRRAWAEKIWLESFRAIHTAIKTTSEPILTSRNTKDHKNSKFCHSTWLPWQHHQKKIIFLLFEISKCVCDTCLMYNHWSPHRLVIISDLEFQIEETSKNASWIGLGWRKNWTELTWALVAQCAPQPRPSPPVGPTPGCRRGSSLLESTSGPQWTGGRTRQGTRFGQWAVRKSEVEFCEVEVEIDVLVYVEVDVEVVRENLEAQPVGENRVADFLPILAILCPVAHAHLNISKEVNYLLRPWICTWRMLLVAV